MRHVTDVRYLRSVETTGFPPTGASVGQDSLFLVINLGTHASTEANECSGHPIDVVFKPNLAAASPSSCPSLSSYAESSKPAPKNAQLFQHEKRPLTRLYRRSEVMEC